MIPVRTILRMITLDVYFLLFFCYHLNQDCQFDRKVNTILMSAYVCTYYTEWSWVVVRVWEEGRCIWLTAHFSDSVKNPWGRRRRRDASSACALGENSTNWHSSQSHGLMGFLLQQWQAGRRNFSQLIIYPLPTKREKKFIWTWIPYGWEYSSKSSVTPVYYLFTFGVCKIGCLMPIKIKYFDKSGIFLKALVVELVQLWFFATVCIFICKLMSRDETRTNIRDL